MKQYSNKNIVFVAIDDFLKPLSTLIESFIRYTTDDINFFLVTTEDSKTKEKISIEKAQRTIDVLNDNLNRNHSLTIVENTISAICQERFPDITPTMFLRYPFLFGRLFLIDMLKPYGIERCIYLDTDTIVNSDTTELFKKLDEVDLIAGALDPACPKIELTEDIENYTNSGMIMMNLKKLREIDFLKHFTELGYKFDNKVKFVDQDLLNISLKDFSKEIVDSKFNYLDQRSPNFKDAVIIHYVGRGKPWQPRGRIRPRSLVWKAFNALNKSTIKGKVLSMDMLPVFKKRVNLYRGLINLRANIIKQFEKD